MLVASNEGELPRAVDDPRWVAAPRSDVRLHQLAYDDSAVVLATINAVSLQAIANEKTIALRLTWDDPVDNREPTSDALAIVFASTDVTRTIGSLHVWPAGDAPSLEAWYWSAADGRMRVATVKGFAPLAMGSAATEAAEVEAAYHEGRRTLVVRRSLPSKDEPLSLAVAAWEGGHVEQGRRRSTSPWLPLVFTSTEARR